MYVHELCACVQQAQTQNGRQLRSQQWKSLNSYTCTEQIHKVDSSMVVMGLQTVPNHHMVHREYCRFSGSDGCVTFEA